MKVFLEISFPDDQAREFMQMLRNFDTKHDPRREGKVTMRIMGKSDQSVEQMKAIFAALKPPFKFTRSDKFDW